MMISYNLWRKKDVNLIESFLFLSHASSFLDELFLFLFVVVVVVYEMKAKDKL